MHGIVCMLVAHNTCTILTETSAPVVCAVIIHVYSVFYLQDLALYCACYHGNVVRTQELLLLGASINYHDRVSYSAHITH